MQEYKTLEYLETGKLAVLKLNRPEKRNALNKEMIDDLSNLFAYLKQNDDVVLLQIIGKGDVFCAGADIAWLKQLKKSSQEQVKSEFLGLSKMLGLLYELPQVVFTMVHGSAYGGALGIMACSDFVLSAPKTVYSFSEINIGLVPATISPFIVNKIGVSQAKKLFFSGEKFNEDKAVEIGLVDQVPQATPGELNYETLMETVLKKPHHALKAMKQLFRGLESGKISMGNQAYSSELIAKLIESEETQELFDSFLTK